MSFFCQSPEQKYRRSLPPSRSLRTWLSGDNWDAPTEFTTSESGQYRIQNNSAEGYLLYVGLNGPPDLVASPAGFSATLPLTLAQPLPGSGTQSLYVVPRYRDSYGCISQNSKPTILMLTPSGPLYAPIPAPQAVVAFPRTNTNLTVIGQYPTIGIDTNHADKVRVWVSTSSPPNVLAVPTYEGTIQQTPFSVSFGAYAAGTYYVAVALYRSSDSASSPVVYTTAVVPAVPTGLQAVFTDNVS